jgi:hypothetical protein
MKIKKEDIIEAVMEADLDPEDCIRWNHSGRGMYGKECFGLIGDAAEFGRLIVELTVMIGADDTRRLTNFMVTDNMGLRVIFYFPGVEVVE